MTEDERWMRRCEQLGEQARERGEAPVGSVVVHDGRLVGEGREAVKSTRDVTCHAEIEAIRNAVGALDSGDLSGCVLYTTHEPCVMCSYAIRHHRIARVVYQHAVPLLGGNTSRMALLCSRDVPPAWNPPPVVEGPSADARPPG